MRAGGALQVLDPIALGPLQEVLGQADPQRPDRAAAIAAVAVGLAGPEGVPGLLRGQIVGVLGDLVEFGGGAAATAPPPLSPSITRFTPAEALRPPSTRPLPIACASSDRSLSTRSAPSVAPASTSCSYRTNEAP